jgi:hypothetical protein
MGGEESVVARRDAALRKFYDDAEGDALVIDKWFTGKESVIIRLPV